MEDYLYTMPKMYVNHAIRLNLSGYFIESYNVYRKAISLYRQRFRTDRSIIRRIRHVGSLNRAIARYKLVSVKIRCRQLKTIIE